MIDFLTGPGFVLGVVISNVMVFAALQYYLYRVRTELRAVTLERRKAEAVYFALVNKIAPQLGIKLEIDMVDTPTGVGVSIRTMQSRETFGLPKAAGLFE